MLNNDINFKELLSQIEDAFDRGYAIGFVDGSVNSTVENHVIPDNKDRIKIEIVQKIKEFYNQ